MYCVFTTGAHVCCVLFEDMFTACCRMLQVDMFALYKSYLEKYPNVIRIIKKLSKSSQLFRRVLRRSKSQGGAIGTGQELIGLLVRPIRMLPSYLAFLKVCLADKYANVNTLGG